jgi:3-oxoacyl-[acyl-carrier protein] reductase
MTRLTRLSRSVAGKIVCVTGAASGIGRATARLFADEGARVVAVDRDGAVEQVVAEIVAAGSQAGAFVVDLADAAAIDALVGDVAARFGGLDVLINNAGVSFPATIDAEHWPAAWEQTFAVNLAAQARLVRGFLPSLLAATGGGRIVNVASTEGVGASFGMTPYTASKHGVIGLTRSLAVELGGRGITVNCICPGPIHTGMTAIIPDEAKERFARRKLPVGRYADPEEVAHAVLSLALPASSFINGAVLVVDGGMTAKNDLGTPRL